MKKNSNNYDSVVIIITTFCGSKYKKSRELGDVKSGEKTHLANRG
jgi:hypothetical protein